MSPIEARERGRGDIRIVESVDFHLTADERQLIANFRSMKDCAQQMIVDLAAQYSCTLPAEPVRLTLVSR
ncbi:hypothetical protein [Massilia rhizosphaerae]|uniref:hypothetical protein n=1 Tax=Massilia rhizosphaerae TaxID=2784389 RepID=UPI0018DCA312|nr:hypothetical protein [Massilia rhizosphaerae]